MRKLGERMRMPRRLAIVAGLATVLAIAAAGTVLADPYGWFGSANDNPWPYNTPGPAPVLAAVGDISCQPGQPEEAEKKTERAIRARARPSATPPRTRRPSRSRR